MSAKGRHVYAERAVEMTSALLAAGMHQDSAALLDAVIPAARLPGHVACSCTRRVPGLLSAHELWHKPAHAELCQVTGG